MLKFKRFPKYMKVNFFIGLGSFIFIIFLTVGYSILSQGLDINGNVLVKGSSDIMITNVSELSATNGGYEVYSSKHTNTTLTTSIGLQNLDSSSTYTVTIINNSAVAKKVKSITMSAYDNDLIAYTIDGIDTNTTFAKSEEKTFTITFNYDSSVTSVPANTILNSLLELEFEEYLPEYAYVEEDMLLDLRGIDAPIDDGWYDRTTNKKVTLSNVNYNGKTGYTFDGESSYGNLGQSIIPKTGDFTLEVMATFPRNILSNTDQTIVSQISDTSNSTGRFKINAYYGFGKSQIRSFLNASSVLGVNPTYTFLESPIDGNAYSLSLVRDGGEIKIYLNGNYITKFSLPEEVEFSDENFKIAKWNNINPQYYNGLINSIRVYGRALSNDELHSNSLTDNVLYREPEKEYSTLYEYALGEQFDKFNGSLYSDNLDRLVYRGLAPSNYLRFAGSDDLYRIIFYNTDKTMKIVNTSYKYNTAFDESGNREPITSTYCNKSASIANASIGQFYGCNAWESSSSFTNTAVTGSVFNSSTANIYLNTIYYDSIPDSVKSKILTHVFHTGIGYDNGDRNTINTQSLADSWTGKIGTFSLADTLNASTTLVNLKTNTCATSNYIMSLASSKDIIWTMTGSTKNTYDVYSIVNGTTVGVRRSSRLSQSPSTMYIIPAFYVSSDVEFTGTGTEANPFIIG